MIFFRFLSKLKKNSYLEHFTVLIGLLYVISGFGGSLLSALFIQSNISLGASSALFGLLGAMLLELITNWTIYANKVAALVTLTSNIFFFPSNKEKCLYLEYDRSMVLQMCGRAGRPPFDDTGLVIIMTRRETEKIKKYIVTSGEDIQELITDGKLLLAMKMVLL
ncbi:hypothetical protein POM88_026090 [Heracleum sosnowskyi]|uniref:RHOMBOID-like protein n=1 Tax=Heracleum sosnowskyi TaxID=360622 RepID=A0AAD8I6A6_9APIA|nr:hypothetical protein POM88_026090 [Heracleum sosnowskyi]